MTTFRKQEVSLLVKLNKLLLNSTGGNKNQILPETHAKAIVGLQHEINLINQNVGIPPLKRLIYENKRFSNISKIVAEFVLAPHVVRNAVLQAIMFDVDLGQWFIAQTDVSTPQGFTITRIDAGGNMLSQMYFPKAGHGSEVFMISRTDDTPLIFFQTNDVYRVTPYEDDRTVIALNSPISFELPVEGNGMVSFVDEVMVSINNTDGRSTLNAYKVKYNANEQTFSFPNGTAHTEFDLKEMLAEDSNVLQGLTVMRKNEITGDTRDFDKYLILIEGGYPDTEFTLMPFEYVPATNQLTKLPTITQLNKMVKPALAKNNIDWAGGFEPEGLLSIRINYGASNDTTVSGLVFGISAGTPGKRQNYVMGFLNPIASKLMASIRSGYHELRSTSFVREDQTKLYEINTPGTYEIKRTDMQRMIDAPSNWRHVDSLNDWTLEVSVNNQHGDVIQTLIKRGLNSQIEKYVRIIDYNASNYGTNFAPRQIGAWNVEKMDGQQAVVINTNNNGLLKRMRDFNVPGKSYYISVPKSQFITDYEGADKFIKGRGFHISVTSWGGAADMFVQKIVLPINGKFMMAYRLIPAKKDVYGPGMIATFDVLPEWTIFEGNFI